MVRENYPCSTACPSKNHGPPVCVLLDVGTKPTGTSIYELWKCRCCLLSYSLLTAMQALIPIRVLEERVESTSPY